MPKKKHKPERSFFFKRIVTLENRRKKALFVAEYGRRHTHPAAQLYFTRIIQLLRGEKETHDVQKQA